MAESGCALRSNIPVDILSLYFLSLIETGEFKMNNIISSDEIRKII